MPNEVWGGGEGEEGGEGERRGRGRGREGGRSGRAQEGREGGWEGEAKGSQRGISSRDCYGRNGVPRPLPPPPLGRAPARIHAARHSTSLWAYGNGLRVLDGCEALERTVRQEGANPLAGGNEGGREVCASEVLLPRLLINRGRTEG